MDIAALQETLRRFAAEREWEPFHTPKNLATALLVEAAELAEIFQWLTPEQSASVGDDVVERERVGEEIADVLLYLVQLADRTGVDVDAAVEKKLRRNAGKHPPSRPGRPSAGARRTPARSVHVLVDCENVQPKEADLRALVADATDVWLFHGPQQKNVGAHHPGFGERATLVPIARTGKNALDFHLTFYIGYIASRHPDARFVVVSNDQGYAPMLEHARELGFDAQAVGFRAPARAAKSRARKSVGTAGTATRTAASKAPAARKAAKKAAVETGRGESAKTTEATADAPGAPNAPKAGKTGKAGKAGRAGRAGKAGKAGKAGRTATPAAKSSRSTSASAAMAATAATTPRGGAAKKARAPSAGDVDASRRASASSTGDGDAARRASASSTGDGDAAEQSSAPSARASGAAKKAGRSAPRAPADGSTADAVTASPAGTPIDATALAMRVGEQLVAMTAQKRPNRRASLLNFIGSRLPAAAADAARLAVLEQLIAGDVLEVDERGAVRYPWSTAVDAGANGG